MNLEEGLLYWGLSHVEEGFGNGATPSFYRLREGNLEEGLLY
jgi:hypothetical protein